MFTEDENTVTHKLFKKGERLYREGSYTLWRDDQNDFYVAYAADDRNSSILDDVRASVRGGKESIADNTVNAKAQVLKIVVTSEAKLEFDIYTQGHGAQEVWLHAPSPHSSARSPRHIVFPEVYFASSQAVWKMRATRRAHFDEVCAPPRLRRTEQSPCALRPHKPRAAVSPHPQILTSRLLGSRSGSSSCRDGNRGRRASSKCGTRCTIYTWTCDMTRSTLRRGWCMFCTARSLHLYKATLHHVFFPREWRM